MDDVLAIFMWMLKHPKVTLLILLALILFGLYMSEVGVA